MFSIRVVHHAPGDARDLGDRVGVKSSVTLSVASSAAYCLVSAFSGSVRMRTKSASVSDFQLDADREAPLQLGDQVRWACAT